MWRARKAIGSRLDIGFFLYQRGVFEAYDQLARNDAAPVMDALTYVFPEAHSLVDVGAGTGRFVAQANELGLSAIGLERSRIARTMARQRAGVDLRPFDLRFRPKPVRVDLAYSFEVAEHIPGWLAARFVHFLRGCAPVIVLTAASPGQGGTGHVNEQPPAYWDAMFVSAGLLRDRAREAAFVERLPVERLSPHWSQTNLFVFQLQ